MELYNKNFKVDSVKEIDEAFKTEYAYDMVPQNTNDNYVEATDIIKIGDRYYKITVEFEMSGAWQNVGDKLYTIDKVTNVSYKEVTYINLVLNYNKILETRINSLKTNIEKLENKIIKL